MKKIIAVTIAALSVSVSISFAQVRSTLDLLGIWTGNQVRVEFLDNSRVSVVFTGNKKQTGTYKSDFLLTPATLEMSFNDGDKLLEFKCLVEFTDNNKLKWEVFSKTSYPRNFTRSYSLLNKVKN